jgi:flagellar basal body rod protein FlgG
MNAQQANIDNVAHNLANVTTTGFKKSRVEFEDLVYQELRTAGSRRHPPPRRRSASNRPRHARRGHLA